MSDNTIYGSLISDEVDVASNEYLTKFSVNRNFVKLLSNDMYLLSKVKDDDATVYSYNRYKSYKVDDLIFFKTSLSAQNTYLLCSLTSDNNFTPTCVTNVAGNLVVVNDEHWKMVGVPTLPELSGHSPTDIADEYVLTSEAEFEANHQDNTNLSAHPLGKFCRQSSSVLFTDLTNLKSDRSTMFYPYKVQKMTSDDTILDGYMRKWDNGILEYDIVFRVGYQGQTDEGYDHLEANNTEYIHRNLNYMYFKNRKDYSIFNQGGDLQAMVNSQKQTNLNNVINAYVGQIVFPEEFKDLNYMVFSSNTKSITTRTYNTKNDVIPADELDSRLSVVGLTIVGHTTLSSEEEEKKLYDTPVNVHVSVQNITEEAMSYIYNRYSRVSINMLSNACLTNIDDKAFFRSELTSIAIPFSARHIGSQAFAKCQQLKHIDFYVEQDPALHPKIELCAFGDTPSLTSINVIYRPTSFSLFGSSPLDDPEVQHLSTYNDIPLNEKLSNELVRTYIYGISPAFEVTNINTTGQVTNFSYSPVLMASSTLCSSNNGEDEDDDSQEDEEQNFVTIDVKKFLEDLNSGALKKNLAKKTLMSAPPVFSTAPTPVTLTTFFEFNDDKTVLSNWKHDQLTDDFEFDSVALFTGSEYTTVTSIADFALSGCNALTSFRAGWPLKNIGYAALSGCSKLNNIVISDSVQTITDYSFADCEKLRFATISCSPALDISEHAFSESTLSALNILPNSTVKADALPISSMIVCSDMSGSYFNANSLRSSHMSAFIATNISSSHVDSAVIPPLSGFSFNSFNGCDVKKIVMSDTEYHDISSSFLRPDTMYASVNPNNILGIKDRTFVQADYAQYKDYPSYLTCISSDGNIYVRQMDNDDWTYQILKGSVTENDIVGFYYGSTSYPLTSEGWSFLVGSTASYLKSLYGVKFVGQTSEHGVDSSNEGYYVLSEIPGVKIPAIVGDFIVESGSEYVLTYEGVNPVWIETNNSSAQVLKSGDNDPLALSLTNVHNSGGSISFNANREVWEKMEQPVIESKSIVANDELTMIPSYLSVGDDYSIIRCDMSKFYDVAEENDFTISILSSFTSLCANSFYASAGSNLNAVKIPNSITSIGDAAFAGNTQLMLLSIQNQTDLKYLGVDVIKDCSSLVSFSVLS